MYTFKIGVFKTRIIRTIIIFTGLLLLTMSCEIPIERERVITRDDVVVIRVDKKSCDQVLVEAVHTGCHEDRNYCANLSSCICTEKGNYIIWTSSDKEAFKLKFDGKPVEVNPLRPVTSIALDKLRNEPPPIDKTLPITPLADECGVDFRSGNLVCRVLDNVKAGIVYRYAVRHSSCVKGKDPIIIIQDPTENIGND